MSVQWTDDQQKVITTRAKNILVSASAGSGKTAVLVARIMSLITDPVRPFDIDRLLIVTFTKAAAGEMKDRIAAAISDAQKRDPDNEHLMRQSGLIHNAKITTIDGFCSTVLRSYCHLTDIEPGFRIAEEGETELLKHDTLENVLQEYYALEDPEESRKFQAFVESFATGKSEKPLTEAVFRVFDACESQPDSLSWLAMCRENNRAGSFEEILGTEWMRMFLADAEMLAREGLRLAKENLVLATRADGPEAYLPMAEEDLHFYEKFFELSGYEERLAWCRDFTAPTLSRKRAGKEENPALRDLFKENRSRHGKIRSDLSGVYYAGSPEQVVSALAESGEVLDELITVTETFLGRYAETKREKKLIDFPDLEHYALKILRDENGERTDAAKELARNFECVMVDEYQDSNYLQEAILTAVTRMEEGSDNYFCVGDVKQSIYGFRHARPDLFMQKFHDYAGEGGDDPISRGVRIDLLKNFRSRKEVLDFSNGLFRQIMRREIGGVDYDRDAELFCGASYPETDGGEYDTEILVAEAKEENADGSTFLEDTRRDALKQLEARMIAERIRELVRHEKITDTKTGKDRPIEYRDIVILLRTMSGYADTFAEVLTACGIPAFSTAKTGYFSAMEVMTILNYLSIVDNPEQDIPFTAVLRSPIVGLSAEEIARIRIVSGSPSSDRDAKFLTMAECARRYLAFYAGAEAGAEGELSGKLERFFSFYGRIRESVPYTPIHELIWEVLTGTGYLDYVSALPGGAQRAANLRMLVEKAIAYEGTSYVGLFNFIRYIRNLRKYDVDFGEVNVLGESENVVRLISIHKSKGLEYPIVFVAGCSKQFNLQDIRASLLIDPEMGLASDYTDLSRRVKYATVKKNAVARKKRREAAGEELRVLYVALTRAKQKLIVTGTIGTEKEFEDLVNLPQPLSEILFEENYILNAKNMLTWILPAASRMQERAAMEGSRCPVRIELVKPSSLVGSAVREGSRVGETLRILSEMNGEAVYDPAVRRIIEERFSYQYPFDGRGAVPVKVSVSELKKESMRDEDAAEVFAEEIVVPFIPSFIREGGGQHEDAQTPDGQITLDAWIRMKEGSDEDLLLESSAPSGGPGGAARGTAYHKVMELLDYSGFSPDQKESTEAVILGQMREFVKSGKMTEEDIRLVDPKNIARFVKSSLGGRMRQAALAGKLRREQPFVLAVKASEIDPSYPEDEDIIVQGIMDAFFYEGEGEKEEIVLLDYKTDRVSELAVLGKRYKVQLDSYAEALTRVTGKNVKEKIIWSFGWGRQLLL